MSRSYRSHRRITALLMAVSLGYSSRVDAREYDYRYTSWFDGEDLPSCQAHLGALVDRFSKATGVSVPDGKCGAAVEIRRGAGVRTVRPVTLYYRSVEPLSFTTALFGLSAMADAPGAFLGAFPNLVQCRASLSRLGDQFSKQMGVPLIDSFCTEGDSTFGDNDGGYVANLVGAPRDPDSNAKTLRVLKILPEYSEMEAPQYVVEDVLSRLRDEGVAVAEVTPNYILYYSTVRAALQVWLLSGVFGHETQCDVQRDRFVHALSKTGSRARPSFYCFGASTGWASVAGFAVWNQGGPAELSFAPVESYTSFEDCMDDLPRIENGGFDYAGPFKLTLGAACFTSSSVLDPRRGYEARYIRAWR